MAAALQTVPLFAQILTSTPAGVVVAHEGKVTLTNQWTADGVRNATEIVASNNRVAVLDALANEAVIFDLATGRATRLRTAETPIAATFLGDELYIVARDARVLQHGVTRIALAPDPAFLRQSNNRLYVYSRTTGALEEIANDRVTRRINLAPHASDFEISGTTAYLVYPRDAKIRTVELKTMKSAGDIAVGAVPVDLAFAGGGTALTARILAVADPSAKRVWLQEGTQSMTQAIARGVLRGFLGLGLFGARASHFPTGVDRVAIRGNLWIAYDSSSGTLYRFTKRTSSVVAKNVPPRGFTLTPDGVAWWNGTSVAQMRLQ
ncbi:MAG TPA: hypothetical protein VGQ76_07570 [Thermoanaerobaculia bacterium]|nr:hypothetical protein [Thermoanaerobaculia bacterium]